MTQSRGKRIPSSMTRDDAIKWLFIAKWAAADIGCYHAAGVLEDVENFVRDTQGLTREMCRQRSDFIIAPGRRGRVTLVLSSKSTARALAFAVAVLRTLEV